jgi:hypothetical protein
MMITVTETEGVTNLPHYKNSRPENLSGSEEKIGVFIAKAIFAFPSGFIFRMIRPLNLEELDGLVAGSTLRLIENAARMFSISQVLLKLDHIMLHFADRILEAATELRHVEYIVDLGEVRRQFQTVCHGSTPGKDTERANVARSQLALDTEAMSAPHGSDTEVSVFTRLILHLLVLTVIVALLTRLGGLEIFLHNTNLIFRFLDKIRSEVGSFPSS